MTSTAAAERDGELGQPIAAAVLMVEARGFVDGIVLHRVPLWRMLSSLRLPVHQPVEPSKSTRSPTASSTPRRAS